FELCSGAAGTVDACYDLGLKVGDVAAGIVNARECGTQVPVAHSWTSDDRGAFVWAVSAELSPSIVRLLFSAVPNEVINSGTGIFTNVRLRESSAAQLK